MANSSEKPIRWLGSAKKDLLKFPDKVIRDIGYGLSLVQGGLIPDSAKVLHGLGSGVWELIENALDGTYRAVYVVRFGNIIYVLHCFQKKSKQGTTTPKPDMDLIRRRLATAQSDYAEKHEKK